MFTSQDVPLSKEWDEKRERLLKEGMEADAVRLDTESCIKEAMRFADEVAKAGNDWRPIRARGTFTQLHIVKVCFALC